MSCFGSLGSGAIILADRGTTCEDVFCREGMVVKDIIDRVCECIQPPIVPVLRPMFSLCDLKSGNILCHMQTLTAAEAARQYVLKVFVNSGENSECLKTYCRAAQTYYFCQLKNDFLRGNLKKHMSSPTTGINMAATEMVLEATKHNCSTYEDVMRLFKVTHFLPSYLKEGAWKVKLQHQFGEYYQSLRGEEVDTIRGHYISCYDRDILSGAYQFDVKSVKMGVEAKIGAKMLISWRNGLIIHTSAKRDIYQLMEIQTVKISMAQLSAEIVSCKDAFGLAPASSGAEYTTKCLTFKSRGDLLTFCSVVDAYCQLKVDCNRHVLIGDVRPPNDPTFFGTDAMRDICHGPISNDSTDQVFERCTMKDGCFLIRTSRSKPQTFILSVCHQRRVCNYRICRMEDGSFSLSDGSNAVSREKFSKLHTLISHHQHFTDGLPLLLGDNCPPSKTGPIPIFPDPVASTPTRELSETILKLIDSGIEYIPPENLKLAHELGSGHFSSVFFGTWTTNRDLDVAVKIPSFPGNEHANDVLNEMERETMTMFELKNEYIVQLLGVSDERHYLPHIGVFPMIVMEFVKGGSLRGKLDKYFSKKESPPFDWQQQFLLYSRQIAEGMEYLGRKNMIHRDLATRNVLVVSPTHVKISDFGLARKFRETKDYYRTDKKTDLPVFWYAPECLEVPQKFSSASDVWSFGVTVWEMFTLGRNPRQFLNDVIARNQGQPLFALAQHIKTSKLPKCDPCPDRVYQVLRNCWKNSPAARITFTQLKNDFAN